jgi:hypothetical protein
MTKGAIFILAVFLLVADQGAGAVALRRMSFQEQVAESDVVVIATARRHGRHDSHDGAMLLMRMRVDIVLKGELAIRTIDVVSEGGMVEFETKCCVEGRKYLLLLRRGRDNIFEGTNGRDSVIRLPR